MGTPPAGQNQHTRIASLHSHDIIVKLSHGLLMLQHVTIPFRRPLHIVLAHSAPFEARVARRRITEVIHIVSCLPQFSHHIRIIPVAPAACYVDLALHHQILITKTQVHLPPFRCELKFEPTFLFPSLLPPFPSWSFILKLYSVFCITYPSRVRSADGHICSPLLPSSVRPH